MQIQQLERIDLNLLVLLHILLEEKSVSGVAKRLGRHPSTVSHALERLRKQIGDPLLVRAGQEMAPTPVARELALPLSDALAALQEALSLCVFTDPSAVQREMVLWMSDYGQAVIMPSLLERLRREAPGLTLVVRTIQGPSDVALRSGMVDAAVLVEIAESGDIHERQLFEDTFVCVMDPDHPAAKGPWNIDVLCAHPHALVAPGGSARGVLDVALESSGRSRRITTLLPHFFALPDIIRGTDLLVAVPTRLAEYLLKVPTVAVRPIPFLQTNVRLRLVWHARNHRDPVHRWLRGAIADCCAFPPPLGHATSNTPMTP